MLIASSSIWSRSGVAEGSGVGEFVGSLVSVDRGVPGPTEGEGDEDAVAGTVTVAVGGGLGRPVGRRIPLGVGVSVTEDVEEANDLKNRTENSPDPRRASRRSKLKPSHRAHLLNLALSLVPSFSPSGVTKSSITVVSPHETETDSDPPYQLAGTPKTQHRRAKDRSVVCSVSMRANGLVGSNTMGLPAGSRPASTLKKYMLRLVLGLVEQLSLPRCPPS